MNEYRNIDGDDEVDRRECIDLTSERGIEHLDAYHDDEINIDEYRRENDWRQWDPEDSQQRAADRHIRNYITNRSVEGHVYNLQPEANITEQERLILYKWTEAVILEISVAQSIAGAATMLSMDQVMVPVYHAIPSGNEIITYDVLRKNAEKLLEMQLNPLKGYIELYNNNPAEYRRMVVERVRQAQRNNANNVIDIPGVININDINPNIPNAEDRVQVNFDAEVARKSMFNVKYLRTLAEQYVKAQKKLRTLSPIAWNSLDDAFNLVEDVFLQQGLNLENYICRDPRKMQTEFKLSRREFITFISRHPLLHTHICKAAGASLQATMNLRDGSYSSLRKYNTNDTRTLVYIFRTKYEVRRSVNELKLLLEDVKERPMLYLEYFLDTTKGIQQTGFQKWLVRDDAPQFPYQRGEPMPAPQPARNNNLLPGWMNNINIMGTDIQDMAQINPGPVGLQRFEVENIDQDRDVDKLIDTVISNDADTDRNTTKEKEVDKVFVHNNNMTSLKDIIGRSRFFSY
ncbi:hypothetical protein GUITHDRAFT_118625 [Guillardia theta CCMP2712]|uniref:Uncharacterized protein n=1 Tax=Guillardia theta (strain CCMP2712) TaxID=905079 RepID=L1IG12_GUITC|nr:hypothetical protein GUITHDRAFT_118625 [Guillardia theta CCMP2712]EKX35183.1 hypothetical protein GUITHDRAFT_118625 [Guillardia theta CCMP2712]|eukprot:XP_005822163.1 hypothetical protein GUITHDRAFT_118625 [Guillardia theta CCMP2712]